MPVHVGHMALIDFASGQCDELTIFLCYNDNEPIKGDVRSDWLKEIYSGNSKIKIVVYKYDAADLTDSSVSSIEESNKWADMIEAFFPDVNVLFSSEKYGDYVADFLKIEHVYFDPAKKIFPVSSSKIRSQPAKFWSFIPTVVQPFFVRKVAIVGSESTGKSTLTEKLAFLYQTTFVAEAARDVIGHTNDCTYYDLKKIASSHARSILEKQKTANKFLFIDTEITITKSYSKFLFNREFLVEEWIEEANQCDLYLFLEPDCPHVQDGTRLNESEKLKLDIYHQKEFEKTQIKYVSIGGNWEERFTLACDTINKTFLS